MFKLLDILRLNERKIELELEKDGGGDILREGGVETRGRKDA